MTTKDSLRWFVCKLHDHAHLAASSSSTEAICGAFLGAELRPWDVARDIEGIRLYEECMIRLRTHV